MKNIIPNETLFYPLSMRGTCPDLNEVNLYTDRKKFVAGTLISFDNQYDSISSISYFLGSLLSSVILGAIKHLNNNNVELDEFEGTIHAQLTNPLHMIPVKGCNDPSEITDIEIKLYFYANHDKEDVKRLINESLSFNPIYRLINKDQRIRISSEEVL